MKSFETGLSQAACRNTPSSAGIAIDHGTIDQAMLQAMAKRSGAKVAAVTASQALFITQPKAVCDVIDEAARGAKAAKQ